MGEGEAGVIHCWLEAGEGSRLPVSSGGVLLGRAAECDLVLESPQVSRHHALVRMTLLGPELIPLGRNPIRVNGATCSGTTALRDGDSLQLPGGDVRLVVAPVPSELEFLWGLQLDAGPSITLTDFPFTIGGAAGDSLVLEGMGPASVRLELSGRELLVSAPSTALLEGKAVQSASALPLTPGMTLELEGHSLTVVRRGLGASTTLVNPSASDPSTVRLQFLPVGGRLFLSILGHELSIYLSERRCALLAVLLQPPGESAPGDYIPDEEVFPRVWGKGQGDRNTLNVLLSRIRKEFEGVGLDGFRYLERMPGGGATRFRVGPATRISVS